MPYAIRQAIVYQIDWYLFVTSILIPLVCHFYAILEEKMMAWYRTIHSPNKKLPISVTHICGTKPLRQLQECAVRYCWILSAILNNA